ncbi:hypothetical protein [Succinimonas sp.]|uniref:hypothetical protein n=1 Tax=Succinimonas sp. TaxID=1936151 RepID=UPI00386D98B4
MTPIDKPSCMPDRDTLPEVITSCGCDLVEFYDEFLEGRTDASFAECKIMFRFGYAMFKAPEADRNREIMEFISLKAPLTISSVKSFHQEYLSVSVFKASLSVFATNLRLFREYAAVSGKWPEIISLLTQGKDEEPESSEDSLPVPKAAAPSIPETPSSAAGAEADAEVPDSDIVRVISCLPEKGYGMQAPALSQVLEMSLPSPSPGGRQGRPSKIHIRFGDLKIDFSSGTPEESVAKVLTLLTGRA